MRIGILCESSSFGKNADIVAALDGRGHELINIGMQTDKEPPLSYIHTSFMAGLLLHLNAVDLIVSGCGTGQGFAIAACQYPGVYCGQLRDPLDAWLFAHINDGNAISLSLNKDYGWAGEIGLNFIFDALFSAPGGTGYPAHRKQIQKQSRERLHGISAATHRPFCDIIETMDTDLLKECAQNPVFLSLIKAADDRQPAKATYLNAVSAQSNEKA